jgi:hypothetical protein
MSKLSLLTLGCFGMLAMIPFMVVSNGILTYYLWRWFVIPIFPTVPLFTLVQAIGLNFFINLFKNHGSFTKKDGEKKEFDFTPLILPWLALLIAWIFKTFFM